MEFPLKGKKLFSAGKLPLDQSDLRGLIREQQGDFTFSLTKDLDYLIVGEKAADKIIEKADSLGIKKISYAEFQHLLNQEFMHFSLDGIDRQKSPEELLAFLSQKNWALWFRDPKTAAENAEKLYRMLKENESVYGISELHYYCTDMLAEQLMLSFSHPWHHFTEICNHDISPCGKYLATACSLGFEPEDKVCIQIWDIENTKPVNQIYAEPYVGVYKSETDQTGIKWSPCGKKIAVAHNLNNVAIFNPFTGNKLAEVSVSDGTPSALPFFWTEDSEYLMIVHPFVEKLKSSKKSSDEFKVSWLPASLGTLDPSKIFSLGMKLTEPGKETDRKTVKRINYKRQHPLIKDKEVQAFYQSGNRIIAIKKLMLTFYDAAGNEIRTYDFSKNRMNYELRNKLRGHRPQPFFPIDDSNFAILSYIEKTQKVIYADVEFDYEYMLNLSVAGRQSWNWNWLRGLELKPFSEFKRP